MSLGLVLALAAGAGDASGQTSNALKFDPVSAGQGTTLLLALDAAALSSGGRPPTSLLVGLPRGMRIDTRATRSLCSSAQAAGGRCPAASKVGFGRLVESVTGYLAPGGETELAWTVTAYLGRAQRPADAASIVLRADLLGADRVEQLLTGPLGTGVPRRSIVSGRVVRRASGSSGVELRFAQLPGSTQVPAPAAATRTRLELAIGAVRRVREDFVRRVRVRTVRGTRTQQIPDHRLVGYDLLRSPERCGGSWAAELRLGFPSGVRRTPIAIGCAQD